MSKELEEQEDDLGFGSWHRQEGTPRTVSTEVIDKVLGDEDNIQVSAPQDVVAQGLRGVAEIKPLAVNAATMVCHRGPCIHLWCLTARSGAQIRGSDKIQITRVRQCNAHYEPTDLSDSNIFDCGLWWPAPLSFIPESLRAPLRPQIKRLWDRVLKHRGYSFDWKWWNDNVFEYDDLARRKQPLGGGAPADLFFNK